MPRVEHHQLRTTHSTRSFAGRSVYLRQEDGNPLPFPHTPAPVQDIEARGLVDDLLGAVATAVKSITDLLGLTPTDPMPPPPGGGGGGGGSSSSSSSASGTGNPGNGSSTQGPSSSSSPANPTSGNPGNGNSNNPGNGVSNPPNNTPGSGNGNGNNPNNGGGAVGTPSASSDPSSPSSTTSPSNSGSIPANQGTAPGDVNELPPDGSSGTPNADGGSLSASEGGHYQGSPNLPAGASNEGDESATSVEIGNVVNAGVNSLTGQNNGFSTRTGAIATTDANGNVVPVSPTSTPGTGNPNAASPSTRIGVGLGVSLAFLAIFAGLFVLRKRRIAKRKDKRKRWWSRRHRSAELPGYYGDEKADLPPNPSEGQTIVAPTLSSSDFRPTFPTQPPVAEVRKPANLIDHPSSEARPLSTGSLISFASSTSSNSLPPMSFTTVTLSEESGTTGESYNRFSSPPPSSDELFDLSFRQISPPPSSDEHFHHHRTSPLPSSDENFAFPAPRVPAQAAIDRTSAYFQPRSPTLSRTPSTSSGSTSQTATTDESAPRTPHVQISSSTDGHERDSNPFADPAEYDLPQQHHARHSHHPGNRPMSLATDDSLRYSIPNSLQSDPFSSSACGSLIASSCYNTFEESEKVYVSFMGNLSDELSLGRGDEVRVLKIFEDGWALVVRSVQDGAEDAERGVIPVVCLSERMAGATGVKYPERGDSYTMSAYIG